MVGRSEDIDDERIWNPVQKFGDILMGDFIECYWNLTLKTVFALNWFYDSCPGSLLNQWDGHRRNSGHI